MPPWMSVASIVISAVALVAALGALAMASVARRRTAAVTPDTRALARQLRRADREQLITEFFAQIEGLTRRVTALEEQTARLTAQYTSAVQKIGLVRFNSEESLANNLSFALALLDGAQNGFIVVSLYFLEGSRVFVREVRGGETERELLPEEREALAQAMRATPGRPV